MTAFVARSALMNFPLRTYVYEMPTDGAASEVGIVGLLVFASFVCGLPTEVLLRVAVFRSNEDEGEVVVLASIKVPSSEVAIEPDWIAKDLSHCSLLQLSPCHGQDAADQRSHEYHAVVGGRIDDAVVIGVRLCV